MRVFVAEDDPSLQALLRTSLIMWGHQPEVASDGDEAFRILTSPAAPDLVLLDWMLPGCDGIELCHVLRGQEREMRPYIIFLTARSDREDIVAGLHAGADDYITKPFHRAELRCRVEIGVRTLALQASLVQRIRELELAQKKLHVLSGLLPICSFCKRIRNNSDYWLAVEEYITQHSDAEFSHGICPECMKHHYPEYAALCQPKP